MKTLNTWKRPLIAAGLLSAAVAAAPAQASDHGDTAENVARIGADLTDLFVFPSPANANNVVMAMNVRGLIPAGQGSRFSFDPGVLYQFKIDNTGDAVEDLVIQARFEGSGPQQRVFISGPVRPTLTGTSSIFEDPTFSLGAPGSNTPRNARVLGAGPGGNQLPNTFDFPRDKSRLTQGRSVPFFPTASFINRSFSPFAGVQAFAGVREDPFFFDLERFYQILPDRQTPIQPPRRFNDINTPDPNAPRANGWRPPGEARDFFRNINVLSFVVELPRTSLVPFDATGQLIGDGKINVWMTTSVAAGKNTNDQRVFVQQDRLARPAVNEVLATVSDNRHKINNRIAPTQDRAQLANDIRSFYRFPAGRSEAIANAAVSVLVPDVMKVDLTQSGPAAYLGVETGGFTGGRFGGRKLQDDVVDLDLGAVFGNTISALGLAPDDGRALPQFTSDNVAFQGNDLPVFPYLPNPA
jgi:hypothetical protein